MDFDFGELMPEFADDIAMLDGSRAREGYGGPERRFGQRRCADNRRSRLRFEPGKCTDRRQQQDRRLAHHH